MSRRRQAVVVGVFAWGVCASAVTGADADRTTVAFEAAAARVRVLQPWQWQSHAFHPPTARDAGFGGFGGPVVAERVDPVEQVLNEKHPVPALLRLLHHDDPRVRTLVVIALFDTEDPQVLPHLVGMADDTAATYRRIDPHSRGAFVGYSQPFKTEPQTVGDVARQAVGAYMEAARCTDGLEGSRSDPGFDDYWKSRGDREWCTSWFAFRLDRATRAVTVSEAEARVRAVRRQIDQVPEPDRTLVLAALAPDWFQQDGADEFVTKAELLALAKKVDPEVWMDVLRQKSPSDDPDLRLWHDDCFVEGVAWFVLSHAVDLLEPRHAEELPRLGEAWSEAARQGRASWGMGAAWVLAAARLDPDPEAGVERLKAAYPRFNGKFDLGEQLALSRALWEIGGRSQAAFLADWFYKLPVKTPYGTPPRVRFLAKATRAESPPDENGSTPRVRNLPVPGAAGEDVKHLVAALVRDPRFGSLDHHSLRELLVTVNVWVERPLVTPEQLDDPQTTPAHGLSAYYEDPQSVVAELEPEKAARVRKNLAVWRVLLRQSVPAWLPQSADSEQSEK